MVSEARLDIWIHSVRLGKSSSPPSPLRCLMCHMIPQAKANFKASGINGKSGFQRGTSQAQNPGAGLHQERKAIPSPRGLPASSTWLFTEGPHLGREVNSWWQECSEAVAGAGKEALITLRTGVFGWPTVPSFDVRPQGRGVEGWLREPQNSSPSVIYL